MTQQGRPFGTTYRGYLRTVAEHFERHFSSIKAVHNYDLGPEFEINLCKALRDVLPQRFGICRGFLVTADGTTAGDDVIVYNRERFSTLRLLDQDSFERKQQIPVESVCAYIEAKHTLAIRGGGGQSLQKALEQVGRVNSLPRERVPLSQIAPEVRIPSLTNRPSTWPQYLNPLYRMIWARHLRLDDASPERAVDKDSIHSVLTEVSPIAGIDALVAGSDFVGLPVMPSAGGAEVHSPFYIAGTTYFARSCVPGLAHAVGAMALLWALDTMQLGQMPWVHLLSDAFARIK